MLRMTLRWTLSWWIIICGITGVIMLTRPLTFPSTEHAASITESARPLTGMGFNFIQLWITPWSQCQMLYFTKKKHWSQSFIDIGARFILVLYITVKHLIFATLKFHKFANFLNSVHLISTTYFYTEMVLSWLPVYKFCKLDHYEGSYGHLNLALSHPTPYPWQIFSKINCLQKLCVIQYFTWRWNKSGD